MTKDELKYDLGKASNKRFFIIPVILETNVFAEAIV